MRIMDNKELLKLAINSARDFIAERPVLRVGLEGVVCIAGMLLEAPQHKSEAATHAEVTTSNPSTFNLNLSINNLPNNNSQPPQVNLTNGQGGLVQITEGGGHHENSDC